MNTPNEERRFVAGVIRPDGTLDTAHAVTVEDEAMKGALTKASERREQEQAEKRKIPEDVQEGSAEALFFNLRNTIFDNENGIAAAKAKGQLDKQREQTLEGQRLELELLDNIGMAFAAKLVRQSLEDGKLITAEEATKRRQVLSANEMFDLVTVMLDFYEDRKDKGETTGRVPEGNPGASRKTYNIDTLIIACRSLQERLSQEALKKGEN